MTAVIAIVVAVFVVGALAALYVGLNRSQERRRASAGLGEADHLKEGDGTVAETIEDATHRE